MNMIQQENIDILGTFSSQRLDLDASLSDGALSESIVTSTIFRSSLGDEQPHHGSIRLANPIKERFNSFDESQELLCLRDSTAQHVSVSSNHDSLLSSTPMMLKPLGCSSNYATTTRTPPAATHSLVSAAPHIDFARYFQDFSSVAIANGEADQLAGVAEDDDFSFSANSILTSDEEGSVFGLYQGSFSWNSQDE